MLGPLFLQPPNSHIPTASVAERGGEGCDQDRDGVTRERKESRASAGMATFDRRALFSFLLSCLIAVTEVVAFVSNAGARESIESIFLNHKRPANFYSIQKGTNSPVCKSILQSVNQEFSSHEDDERHPGLLGELLLSSDLQVHWQNLDAQVNDQPNSITESAEVSSRPRARPLRFVRRTFRRFYPRLGFEPAANDLSVTVKSASPRSMEKIVIDLNRASDVPHAPNLAVAAPHQTLTPYLFLNVVVIDQELYLLAIDALEAQVSLPKALDGEINLYVLKLNNAHDVRAICQLLGSG